MERFIQLPMDLREPEDPEEDFRQRALIDALAAYELDVMKLRNIAQLHQELPTLLREGSAPDEAALLVVALSALLRPTPREQIKSPADAAAFLMMEMGHLQQEQFRVLCLDTKNRLQRNHMVYQGSLNAATIRISEVFQQPILLNSAAIICAHNHPSGEPTPSPEDIFLTRQVVDAGKLLDIDVLDHLVIGQGKFVSMRERGLGFSNL